MMERIKELDNKYLVLKWDDINNNLSRERKQQLDEMIGLITHARATEGKLPQSYIVLNRSDDIHLGKLKTVIHEQQSFLPVFACSVDNIAVGLINSILCDTPQR